MRATTAVQPEGSLTKSGSVISALAKSEVRSLSLITFQDILVYPQKRVLETLLIVFVLVFRVRCQALENIASRIFGNVRSCLCLKNGGPAIFVEIMRQARDHGKRHTAMAVIDSKERVPRADIAIIVVQLKLRGVGVFHA